MLQGLLLKLLNIYQRYVRPAMPLCCRFTPSCSEYTRQAIIKYGALKGIGLGMVRLLNCHPLSGRNGCDPLK